MLLQFFPHTLEGWIWPVAIFMARIGDVTLGTIRIMFISRNMKKPAAIAGFFESIIWVFAISKILENLGSPINIVAYAGGYATGTLIGIKVEEYLSLGNVMLRIFASSPVDELVATLKEAGFGLTRMEAQGLYGPVEVMMTVIDRKDRDRVVSLIRETKPNAVYTVEDVRHVSGCRNSGNGGFCLSKLGVPSFFAPLPRRVRARV